MMNFSGRTLLTASAVVASVATAMPAKAQVRSFDVPAQSAVKGIALFGKQADIQIMSVRKDTRDKRTNAVRGELTIDQALGALLAGTGLSARKTGARTYSIYPLRGSNAVSSPSPAPAIQASADAEAGAALAGQDRSAPDASNSEDIVVTAARREQRLVDVPMSITAVSQDELDRRGIESVLDLSRSVPGLVVTETGPGQNRIFMRGVANGNGLTSLVGVYLDEIPVTGVQLGQPDLQLVDLERVEVLRGPQGTLYGQGSAGGTVRFITRRPDLNGFSGEASLSAYATEHGDFSERLTGVVNVPVIDDVLGVRVSGTLANIGGWVDQPAAGREDINDQLIRNVRVKALWRPSDNLDILGTVIVHRNKGDGLPAGADADYNVSFPNGDPLAQQGFVDNYEIYNLTATYDFGSVALMSSTSYVEAFKKTKGISLKVPGLETFNIDTFDTESFTQEIRLSSSGKRRLNWVLGAFYTDETVDRLLVLNLYSGGVPLGVTSLPEIGKSETISIFGDVSFSVTDRLDLGAGIRYFHDKRRSLSGTLDLGGTFKSVNPRFYASYDLARDITLYANVAKGFRSGGFLGDEGASTFDPETVWSYEVGTKGVVKQFRWELTGFFTQYQGYQAFVLTDGVFGGIQNAGDGEAYGVDWLVAVDPVPNLTLQLSGNVTKAELVSVLPTSTSNISGDRIDFIPDYSLAASAEYRFNWGSGAPGFARIDYNQIGRATMTDRSLGLINFPTDTMNLLNARLGLAHGPWEFEIFGENLFGENGLQDPLASLGFGARPRPRVIGAKIRTSF